MAVFHRPPDYDANADPIVRVTAGEIRKRIAQYYHEEDAAGEIQIDLRPGSYVPEFHPVAFVATEIPKPSGGLSAVPELSVPKEVKTPPLTSSTGHRSLWRRNALAIVSIALLISAIVAGVVRWRMPDDQRSQMWYPLLNSPAPVLLVVGQPHIPQTETPSANSAYEHSPASELELPDAIAMAHLCAMLDAHRHLYQIIGVSSASLSDLRKGPAILVGRSKQSLDPAYPAPASFLDNIGWRQRCANSANHRSQESLWFSLDRGLSPTHQHDHPRLRHHRSFSSQYDRRGSHGGRRTRLRGHGERQQVYQLCELHEATDKPCATRPARYEYGSRSGNRGDRRTCRPPHHHCR